MSEEEKSAQIGEEMLTLQRQRSELGHIEEKIEKVRRAYRTFASEWERWRIDVSDNSKVFLLYPATDERGLAAYLLPQSELAALILARQAAEESLKITRGKLANFGITSI